jgi:hypothetical protein
MKNVKLDIPEDARTRIRRSVIREILIALATHELNIDQASQSIEHIIKAETDQIIDRSNLSNKDEA